MQRTLLFTLLASLVLAGCAGTTPTPPKEITAAEAEALVGQAAADMPEVFAMDAKLMQGSKELLTIAGVFDNATGTTYLDLKGDIKSLSPSMSGQPGMAGLVGDALTVYMVKDHGAVYYVNGTAFAFPETGGAMQSMLPTPQQAGAGALVDPRQMLGASGDINVTSVTATTWQGKPAFEVKVTRTTDGDGVNATLVVLQSPARLVHIESTLPREKNNPADPFSGALLTADLVYEGDLKSRIPARITRAAGLAHTSDQPGFPGTPLASQNWTFEGDAGLALAEIEARVLNGSSSSGSSGMGAGSLPGAMPVLWSMKLSEATKSGDGVTLTFTDADADGKVSKGDVLRIDVASGARAQLALYDTVTQTYVVPGAGVALAALALVGVAVAMRRR